MALVRGVGLAYEGGAICTVAYLGNVTYQVQVPQVVTTYCEVPPVDLSDPTNPCGPFHSFNHHSTPHHTIPQ